jgi:hypothetical protein
MELRADARLPFPRLTVFRAYRDRILDTVQYLPNVKRIEVKSTETVGPVTQIVNIWHGGGEIPRAAQAVISEAMLSWTDRAKWDETEFTCEWKLETHALTEAVHCAGKNMFVEDGGGTLIQIRGELTIDASKIRGVPGFLAGKVGKTVEDFLGKRIQPNLVEVSQALGTLLEKDRA